MIEFFMDINFPYLDHDRIETAAAACRLAIATGVFYEFNGYRSTEKFVDAVSADASLNQIIDDCNCNCTITTMLLPPGFVMDIHQDTYYPKSRKTAMLIPLLPETDIAPTSFYESQYATSPLLEISWQHGRPKLLNVMPHWHNVINNQNWRCMLQISFDHDYDTVVDMIHSNKLFKTLKCTPV
jgi:hypothetical protein